MVSAIEQDPCCDMAICSYERVIKGGNYPTYGDHRIAMALAVASLGSDSQIVMDDVTCMDKSFPAFMQTFKKFSGQ